MKKMMLLLTLVAILFVSANVDVNATAVGPRYIRSSTDVYTITDSGRMNQEFDEVNFEWFGLDYAEMQAANYNYVQIEIEAYIREINEGYQWFFIYNSRNSAEIGSVRYLHGGSGLDGWQWNTTTIIITVPLDSFNDVNNLQDNFFTIRYGAEGSWSDTWEIHSLKLTLTPKY
ncbi:MAG: hypothetical protein QM489_05890 [Candidatus Izemoplasma sp.]